MAVKNTAQVVIGGKIITLGGFESEEYFQKVASYMNNKIGELSETPGYSRQPMETKHMLLSLNITDDYFKAKRQAEVFEQDLQQKDQEMYELKHELIALRMQIEDAQKKEQELQEQKKTHEEKIKEQVQGLQEQKRADEEKIRELEQELQEQKKAHEEKINELEQELDELLK